MSKSLFGFGIMALILSVASVSGQQLGTVEQARAMLDRAISALKSNEATALSEFNDPNNKQFHERDLYVFCYDISDGKITAYESPALLNIDVRTLALQDDPIGKRAYDAIENVPEASSSRLITSFRSPVRPSRFQNKLSRRALAIKPAESHPTNNIKSVRWSSIVGGAWFTHHIEMRSADRRSSPQPGSIGVTGSLARRQTVVDYFRQLMVS